MRGGAPCGGRTSQLTPDAALARRACELNGDLIVHGGPAGAAAEDRQQLRLTQILEPEAGPGIQATAAMPSAR